jgi:quinol monooxygenase YgiN
LATILAHIRVKPGHEASFEQTIRHLYAVSHGNEPGLRHYEYWRAQEARLYYCLLAFDDFMAFLSHQCSAHHEAAVEPLMAAIEAMQLEWVDPVQGAAPLPATRAQAVEASASELVHKYAQMCAVQEADWWLPLR